MQLLISVALWVVGGIYFLCFLLVALVLSYLFPFRTIDPLLKAWMRGLFRLLFIRVEVEGLELVDPERTVIFTPNHTSMLDIPLVAGFVPGFVRGIEASRQHGWPLYGRVMGRLGNIPIERDNVHASISAMKRAARHLESTGSLIIFPEGGRSANGRLRPFKKLPFHLARETGTPVLPVAIRGMYQVNNKTSWRVRPGTVTIRFGEEVGAEEVGRLSTAELKENVEGRVRAALEAEEAPTPVSTRVPGEEIST